MPGQENFPHSDSRILVTPKSYLHHPASLMCSYIMWRICYHYPSHQDCQGHRGNEADRIAEINGLKMKISYTLQLTVLCLQFIKGFCDVWEEFSTAETYQGNRLGAKEIVSSDSRNDA